MQRYGRNKWVFCQYIHLFVNISISNISTKENGRRLKITLVVVRKDILIKEVTKCDFYIGWNNGEEEYIWLTPIS